LLLIKKSGDVELWTEKRNCLIHSSGASHFLSYQSKENRNYQKFSDSLVLPLSGSFEAKEEEEETMSSEKFEEIAPPMPPALKAITLTYVRYQRGDPFGLCLAWVSLIPVFISLGGFVSHFLFRREIQGLCFTLGLLISQFLNELVKSSVQQSRPETCALLEACDSHGWPSSHSQYMFFFAAYLTLLCLKGSSGVAHGGSKVFLAIFPWPFAVLTMYSRVYLGYHTVSQVLNRLMLN
jgi:PAP2 superfamily